MPIELRIRNLQTREGSVVRFDDEVAAAAWLRDRPRFVDVMGLAGNATVPDEVQARLRAAMRPLDADERIAERELANAADRESIDRDKRARIEEAEAQARHAQAMLTADPDRLMEVHWRFDQDMRLTDAADPRPITPEAREAVLAWIAERCEWVAGRGQTVGECTVKVWPGKMPPKETERVKEGRFFPVSAGEVKKS